MKVKRGDIVWLKKEAYKSLAGRGHIQGGERPFLIVSNDIGNDTSGCCIAVPLTRQAKKRLPTHVWLRTNSSIALCEQIFTFTQDEVARIDTKINEYERNKVNKCLMISLDLERG